RSTISNSHFSMYIPEREARAEHLQLAPAAVGRLPIRPPAQVRPSVVRPASARPCWRKLLPRELQAAVRADDYPSSHPLKIDRPSSGQLPPGRADANAPRESPAAVGRLPNHPPSRDLPIVRSDNFPPTR